MNRLQSLQRCRVRPEARLGPAKPLLNTFFGLAIVVAGALAGLQIGQAVRAQDAGEAGEEAAEVTEAPKKQWKALPAKEPKNAKQLHNAKWALKGVPSGDEKLATEYYTFRVTEMTTEENRGKLDAKRKDWRSMLRQVSDQKDLHDKLITLLIKELPGMANDAAFHPAVRCNAILLLGELNEQEPDPPNEPVPLPAALKILLDTTADDAQDDVVRIGALAGVLRHVQLGAAQEHRARVVQITQRLIRTKVEAGKGNMDGRIWMRRQVIDILEAMAEAGWQEAANAAMSEALVQAAAEPACRLSVRCDAAEALGALQPSSIANDKVIPYGTDLGYLLVAVLREGTQLARPAGQPAPKAAGDKKPADKAADKDKSADAAPDAKAADKAAPKAGKDGKTKTGASRAKKAAAPVEPTKDERARLVKQLEGCITQVEIGLQGPKAQHPPRGLLAAATADTAKQFVNELLKRIVETRKVTADGSLTFSQFADGLRTQGQDLESWLQAQGQGASPAAATVGAATDSGKAELSE